MAGRRGRSEEARAAVRVADGAGPGEATSPWQAPFDAILTGCAQNAAAQCAEVLQKSVENARSEERHRILMELRSEREACNMAVRDPYSAWTRGFYDARMKEWFQKSPPESSQLGPYAVTVRPPARSALDASGTAASAPSDAKFSSEQNSAGNKLDYTDILRRAFKIKDEIHLVLMGGRQKPAREPERHTCDIRSIVHKVHLLWKDKVLEDSDDEGDLERRPGRAKTEWETTQAEQPPRKPHPFPEVLAQVCERERKRVGTTGFGLRGSRRTPRKGRPPQGAPEGGDDQADGCEVKCRRSHPPIATIRREEDVDAVARTRTGSAPPAVARASAAQAAMDPDAAARVSPGSLPPSPSHSQNGWSPQGTPFRRSHVPQNNAELSRTLQELTALLQEARIIGASTTATTSP